MTFDVLKQLLFEHRLVVVYRAGSQPDTIKCACGAPFLREEQWAQHAAEIIVLESKA